MRSFLVVCYGEGMRSYGDVPAMRMSGRSKSRLNLFGKIHIPACKNSPAYCRPVGLADLQDLRPIDGARPNETRAMPRALIACKRPAFLQNDKIGGIDFEVCSKLHITWKYELETRRFEVYFRSQRLERQLLENIRRHAEQRRT